MKKFICQDDTCELGHCPECGGHMIFNHGNRLCYGCNQSFDEKADDNEMRQDAQFQLESGKLDREQRQQDAAMSL